MYILFTDETNLTPDPKAKFFVYGGLFFPIEYLAELDKQIKQIRAEAGYLATDNFKFDTRTKPKQVTSETAKKAKEAVIDLCISLDCKFIAYVVLHDIVRNVEKDSVVLKGADHVVGRFNKYLSNIGELGVFVIDRLSSTSEYKYLKEKFCNGLSFSNGKNVALDRIKLFCSTCNNASHASSAMDIVLGTFRYCINQPKNIGAAKKMMHSITKMIWHTRVGETIYVMDKGLIFRPKVIKVDKYKKEYDQLLKHINCLLVE